MSRPPGRWRRQREKEQPAFERDLASRTQAITYQALVLAIQGNHDMALASANRAIAVLEAVKVIGSPLPELGAAYTVASLVHYHTGELQTAREEALRASEEFSGTVEDPGLLFTLTILPDVLDSLGESLRAVGHLSQLAELFEGMEPPYPEAVPLPRLVRMAFERSLSIGSRFEKQGLKTEEMKARQPLARLLVLAAKFGVLAGPPRDEV